MATYNELHALIGSNNLDSLRQKIVVGIAIKAQTIAANPASAQAAKDWAKEALAKPTNYLDTVLNYVLAANNTATTTQIQNATDSTVQTAVNTAVDNLLGA